MKIKVNELGAIKEGVIDLSKKLTVFCGPNGTGKTYMAYLIYAITKANIHIRFSSENTIVNELIEKKEKTLPINFKEIENYKGNIIDHVLSSFDSLFGVGVDDARNYFNGVELINQESIEDFKIMLTSASFMSSFIIGNITVLVSKTIIWKYWRSANKSSNFSKSGSC